MGARVGRVWVGTLDADGSSIELAVDSWNAALFELLPEPVLEF